MEKKMKKLALSAILGASLMISTSAFALTTMSADSMKAATGQAGVSITLDNVVIEQFTGSTTYTDTDGTNGTAGSVVISDKHVVKEYYAMTSATDYAADFLREAGVANKGTWLEAAALNIDVGNCSILAAGVNANNDIINAAGGAGAILTAAAPVATAAATYAANPTTANLAALAAAKTTALTTLQGISTVRDISEASVLLGSAVATLAANAAATTLGNTQQVTGVVIGLPTLLISTSSDTYSVGVAGAGINSGSNFIKIAKGQSAMAILGGIVEIAAH
jgi:hypothetical protein